MSRTPQQRYLLAIACHLSIPAVMILGTRLAFLIDPEMARGHADYARDYRILEWVQRGALLTTAGLMLVLWIAVCHQVLAARQRSTSWLALAVAGPFGFMVMAMLGDRSPAPLDPYQQFIRKLNWLRRVALEIAVFVAVWFLAFGAMVLKSELMIRAQSFLTGMPVADIIAIQTASSGMWAFREGLEVLYLVVLIYLLWPLLFNLVARRKWAKKMG